MDEVLLQHVINSVKFAVDTVLENEEYFCELDSATGDGDFGNSIAKGFRGIKDNWEILKKDDIGCFIEGCGLIIMEKCGGATGPIWGIAFRYAGNYAKGKKRMSLKELSEFFQSMVEGVKKVGGAKLGDKTLLDALIPATESLKISSENKEDLLLAFKKSVGEALKGAENTKKIVASKGRASYLGDRSIGYYDAGAKAVAVLLESILNKCPE